MRQRQADREWARERAMRNQMSVRVHKKWVTPQSRRRQPVWQTMNDRWSSSSSSSALGEEQTSLCVCLSLPTSRTRLLRWSAPDRASPAQAAAANLSQQLFNCRTLLPVYRERIVSHRKDQSNGWRRGRSSRSSSSSVGTRETTPCTLLAPRLLFSWRRELGVCRICSN